MSPPYRLRNARVSLCRTMVNVDGAIELCLRKADNNKDAKLSWKEFRSLMRCLREPRFARYSANLVFALFDLDNNRCVGREEFRELFRFLLGRSPTFQEFEREWDRLVSPNGENPTEYVDQRSYIRWLQTSEEPAIRQQAPECQAHSAAPKTPKTAPSPSSPGSFSVDLSGTEFPKWNQRFNISVNPGHVNDSRPAGLREYFSRQQSMPELRRFWEAHGRTFRNHLEALDKKPSTAPCSKLFPKQLSTEGGTPMTLPQRHSPGGSMHDLLTGEVVAWHDYWTPPARYRRPFDKQHRPLLPFETFGDVKDASARASELRKRETPGGGLANFSLLIRSNWIRRRACDAAPSWEGRKGGDGLGLARMQKEIEDKTSAEYQRQTWEALRKSINGLVNKVNVGNIKNIVEELFQENLVRGRGLLVRALIRAQMASPGFTHVFAALLAVINSKLPEVGDLLIRRVILQFRRAYKRNDKIVTTAAIKFMAHLVNQKICSELLALHVATLLLERVTEDSIEVCVSFLQEVGQALEDLSKSGCQAIFERFRTILHEGEIDKRVQYVIEGLFETRRKKFSDHPMVLEELDLVDDDDQITHEVDLLEETVKGEETLNIFKAIPPEQYAADEAKWKLISSEILGLEQDEGSDSSADSDEEADAAADRRAQDRAEKRDSEKILDFTEQDLVNLRRPGFSKCQAFDLWLCVRQIYLVIMSSVHFEANECVHKILKLNIAEGQEKEVCTMLIDCCAMEKMFNRFFVLQAERLCRLNPIYQDNFTEAFGVQFNTVHRLETNKLRNIGKFFAHLLYTDAIPWSIWAQVKISEETTTSSSRIFIKVIFQELSEQWGIKKLVDRLREEELKPFFVGLFPKDHPKNVRFAINYFTAIGLGVLTEDVTARVAHAASSLLGWP
ncbi:unnamed protein product [Effrenium voratum]|nr:unnamed protein product [Effrenium voratum]